MTPAARLHEHSRSTLGSGTEPASAAAISELCAADSGTPLRNGHNAGVPCLAVSTWLARDIPSADYLMGEWLSTTSRAMLVAPTGLGKTNFCLALSFAVALGRDFLRWRARRPARVLFVDGEMSKRLMKARLTDAARRAGAVPSNLFVLCRDDLDSMPPLNTSAGQQFVDACTEQIGGVDLIIFDNIQSLLVGDMKEEQPWQDIWPWIRSLTGRAISQVWVHHTGHNENQSYGTKTREWGLDTVILLKRAKNTAVDIAFNLEFTKARERAPHNRADFETVTITLAGDRWSVDAKHTKVGTERPSPLAGKFYAALISAITRYGAPRRASEGLLSVTKSEWRNECVERGLLNLEKPDSARALLSNYQHELKEVDWIRCDGDFIWQSADCTTKVS
jgi:hypothetical protein